MRTCQGAEWDVWQEMQREAAVGQGHSDIFIEQLYSCGQVMCELDRAGNAVSRPGMRPHDATPPAGEI